MPKYQNIREEELKNKIAEDYFADYDATKIIGNVDFCVSGKTVATVTDGQKTEQNSGNGGSNGDPRSPLQGGTSLLWAEAKKGKSNIYHSLVQLILTIGKARTFDKELPPSFLGAFDAEQIAFIPYSQIQEVFYQNDFNWNVTPSNYETKEFKQLYEMVEKILISQNSLKSKKPNAKQKKILQGILKKLE